MPRSYRSTIPVLAGLLLASLLSPTGLAQEGSCDAYAQATLETNEQGEFTALEFSVEISTSEDCAKIEYDLILDELMPNGQTKKERIPRFVKLNDGGYNEVVDHQIPASFSLSNYEAKVVSCQKCSIMP